MTKHLKCCICTDSQLCIRICH